MNTQIYSETASGWLAPRAYGAMTATVSIPGSKSLSNRELVLSALAETPSFLHAPLRSDDSLRMIESLRALGVRIDEHKNTSGGDPDLHITPAALQAGMINCGQAGTVMRFLSPVAGLVSGMVTVTADASALHRPMAELIDALKNLGLDIDDGGRRSLPFTVHGHGRVRGGSLTIDASVSSQFVSGLLLAAPRFQEGLHLTHRGERLPSTPHIEMTIRCLANRGVTVTERAAGEWVVEPGPIAGRDLTIEPDLSNAAPFLAAALVTGGTVTVTNWPEHSTQPGAQLPNLLGAFGAETHREGDRLTISAPRGVHGAELNLGDVGELAPTLVGVAALADGESELTGIGHIRAHETDRLAALVNNLRALGGDAEELPDGIRIRPRPLHGGLWGAYHDHRMATTGALIGLVTDGVVVDDIGATAKTLPSFSQLWGGMLEGNTTTRELA